MNYDSMCEPTECRMVVATADIAGFCKACQGKSDLDTFRMLDEFCHLVDGLTTDAGGRVLKFMGDAALMVYPEENAAAAVASLASLRSEAQAIWTDFDETCVVRTKAHVGSVVCGPMGPAKRFDAIGNTLNELFRMPWDGPELSVALSQLVGA
jgi:adenylate cyclase